MKNRENNFSPRQLTTRASSNSQIAAYRSYRRRTKLRERESEAQMRNRERETERNEEGEGEREVFKTKRKEGKRIKINGTTED